MRFLILLLFLSLAHPLWAAKLLSEGFDDNAAGLASRGWYDRVGSVTCFDTVNYSGGKFLKWTWASSHFSSKALSYDK